MKKCCKKELLEYPLLGNEGQWGSVALFWRFWLRILAPLRASSNLNAGGQSQGRGYVVSRQGFPDCQHTLC